MSWPILATVAWDVYASPYGEELGLVTYDKEFAKRVNFDKRRQNS